MKLDFSSLAFEAKAIDLLRDIVAAHEADQGDGEMVIAVIKEIKAFLRKGDTTG